DQAYNILNEIKENNKEIDLRVMGEVYSIGCNKIDIDYSQAIEYFTKAFNNGSIYSAFILGNLYLNGYKDSKDKKNIPRDIKKAIEWLDKGIEANNTSCMETMSFICRSQDSIYVQYHNIEKGIDLLKKAIRHGSSEAMYKLGKEYQYGENIGKDDEKAFDLYMKSFELNNPNGAFMLGISYMHGIGCEKDVAKGVEVWKKAVEYGDGSSANNLFCYYAYGEFSNDKSVINYELAKKFLKEGAKLGDGMACWNLGRLYYSGNFLFEKNDIQSFIYSKQAADKGIVDACRAVAYMYQQGIGCRKDLEESKKYEEMGKAKEE
ncbi:MAG: tetratricopeptide repeat protein, partial [Prevotellaceae bacterium]|nr:tetratricopeptide repeat protein [Prevotellaceae bacterium]